MKNNVAILLVEDEALIAMNEAFILERQGFTVETVATAEDAVKTALTNNFDLILMDIDLGHGRMNGTEAALKILAQKEIPIVFCTSHTEKETVEQVKNITKYGYILKNSGEFVLIESINMALELFNAHCCLKRESGERNKAEKKQRWSASLYNQIKENSIDAAYLLSGEGQVIEVNRMASLMLGYSEEEFLEMTIDDIDINYPLKDFKDFWKDKTIGSTILFESTHKHKNGRLVPVQINGILFSIEGETFFFGMARDISHQKQDEKLLKQSEQRYLRAQHIGNVGNWEYNIQTNEFWGSDQAKRIYGLDPGAETFSTEEVEECIIERERVHQALVDLIEEEKEYKLEFDIIPHNTDEKKTIISLAELERDSDGNPYMISGVIHDVTEQKKTEAGLKKALEQKEVLMKELYHRVKNNLLMVSSLIAFTNSDIGSASDLSGLQNQIEAIMNTYDSLYQTEDSVSINIERYLVNLLNNVFKSYQIPIEINIECDIDKIPSANAVYFGLIVNEAAINAMKHGFDDIKDPKFGVRITYDRIKDEISLKISNNGNPISDSVSLVNPGTLGLKLISALVEQMNGSVEVEKSPHPVILFMFPAENII